jgi:hypothetical protein
LHWNAPPGSSKGKGQKGRGIKTKGKHPGKGIGRDPTGPQQPKFDPAEHTTGDIALTRELLVFLTELVLTAPLLIEFIVTDISY